MGYYEGYYELESPMRAVECGAARNVEVGASTRWCENGDWMMGYEPTDPDRGWESCEFVVPGPAFAKFFKAVSTPSAERKEPEAAPSGMTANVPAEPKGEVGAAP